LCFGANRGFNLSAKIWIWLAFISLRTLFRSTCPSSKRSKQTNHTTQAAPCTSREGARTPHGPALYPALSPDISGQGRSLRGAPRRPIAATPQLRPVLDHKAGTEATHLRLQHGAAFFKTARRATTSRAECRSRRHTAHSRTVHRSSPRAPQAQDKAPRQEES